MNPERVESLLGAARDARARGATSAVLDLLRQATASGLPPDHPLTQVAAWRLAKAEYDFGTPRGMLDAIGTVLASPQPFEHYPAGLDGVDRLARRCWDRLGYGETAILELWRAAERAWRVRGDDYLASVAEMNQVWHHACVGARPVLIDALDRWNRATPRSFGEGPRRHPRAADAPTSVVWVQMELARTCLWAACWTRDEALAAEALDLMEDAAEEADLERSEELWYLDPVGRVGLTFGWTHAARWVEGWRARLRHAPVDRQALHLGLLDGLVAQAQGDSARAAARFLDAFHHAGDAGPEWSVDAQVEAARVLTGDARERHLADADARATRYGVSAFRGALDQLGSAKAAR